MDIEFNAKRSSGRGLRGMKLGLTAVAVAGLVALGRLGVELYQLKQLKAPSHAAILLPRHKGGTLVICGGGKLPDEIRDRFVALAGGSKARLVLIPTAHQSADSPSSFRDLDEWKARGVSAVSVLHTRSRQQADDPTFIKPLSEATGVWFSGGKQTLLTEVYRDTLVEKQLKALLDRGGVIGGTSAGAAVMTRTMIESGRGEKVVVGQGFDLLPGSVVDQHFMKRNRVGRLFKLLTDHPGLVGFGIDEGTALIVQGTSLDVIGQSYVLACLPGSSGHLARYEFLRPGDHADLSSLKDSAAQITSTLELDEVLSSIQGQ